MSRVIFIIVLASVFASCGTKEKESATKSESTSQPKDSTTAAQPSGYTYQIIQAPENTFGYDIYRDAALFIHQPHVPGMAGIKGFARESQAKKAAELMIEKINKGIVPPTLAEEEVQAILEEN